MKRIALISLISLGGVALWASAQTGKGAPSSGGVPSVKLKQVGATEPVEHDADDPAIWRDAIHPEKSLILGTDKGTSDSKEPSGGLYVFDLNGKLKQKISGINRPNNVDVEYGFLLGAHRIDIAVLTERKSHRLRVFKIDSQTRRLTDISSEQTRVFEGETGDLSEPMGVALYKRQQDGVVFAVVSRKSGPKQGYLAQYKLEDAGNGKVKATRVRTFGAFSGEGEIEAVLVDDEMDFIYYSDEGAGIRKYRADPNAENANRELALFGQSGFQGDCEGLALYATPGRTGFLLCSDQIENGSEYHVYKREGEGEGDNQHNHARLVKVLSGGADSTDGLDASSESFGARFPRGLIVAMNSKGKNFLIFSAPF